MHAIHRRPACTDALQHPCLRHQPRTMVARASNASWQRRRRHLLQLSLCREVPEEEGLPAGGDQPLRLAASAAAALGAATAGAGQEDACIHFLGVALQEGVDRGFGLTTSTSSSSQAQRNTA